MKFKNIICILLGFLSFLAFYTNVENVKIVYLEAINFCLYSLVPSLMIPMIISTTILYTKAFEPFFDKLSKSTISILGICRKYISIVFVSSLCGFIIGPKIICENFIKNKDDKNSFSNAIILSSNAGIGFLVGCVGGGIWGDKKFGIYLFFAQIICSLLLGKILLKDQPLDKEITSEIRENYSSKLTFSGAISKAISGSSLTLISLSAFVIFFSCVTKILVNLLNFSPNSPSYIILNLLFEFCRGSYEVVKFPSQFLSAFFTGFCVGFGGICVHFQTFAVCEGYPLDKKKFVLFKLIHGILCGLCALLYVLMFDITPVSRAIAFSNLHASSYHFTYVFWGIALLGTLFCIINKTFLKIVLIFK